ncbi:MAG: hypothetical protein HQ505_03870 [Nitrosopumilus sp.]|nr:hypothetical protein [Nitrosopumilus sp.]
MNKRAREKDAENAINDALKHEENVQHDENEEPIAFVNKKQIKSLEHDDLAQHDENDEPVTFTDD